MSTREVTYYIAFCDCCKDDFDYGDFTAWADFGAAVEMAGDDLTVIDGLHYCLGCWEWSADEENQVPKGCTHPQPHEQEPKL